MQILVQADGTTSAADLRPLVVRRLRFALLRLRTRVISVRVRFADVNGPRGGLDKCARLQLVLAHGSCAVLHDRDRRWPDLIDRLVDRAARAVVRLADRTRTGRRTPRDRARPWSGVTRAEALATALAASPSFPTGPAR